MSICPNFKMRYNTTRADHKIENRKQAEGKQF